MYEVLCKNCKKGVAGFDYPKTIHSCMGELDYLRNSIETIQDKWMVSKLIYTCSSCNKEALYTLEEIFEGMRAAIAQDVIRYKRKRMFQTIISPGSINEDNGISYCGKCEGADGEGWCYNDVIRQCILKDEL